MPSKIKILPSDIVLMIIDYLDSPSMMNCRQVCRTWLDVIERNRFLWNYFLVLDDDRRYTLNMLNFFSSKSNHSLKAFELFDPPGAFNDATSKELNETSSAIVDTLLKSKDSLEVFSHLFSGRDYFIRLYFLRDPLRFSNLRSFCGQDQGKFRLSTRIRIGRDTNNGANLKSSLVSIASDYDMARVGSLGYLVKASTLTLVHLKIHNQLLSQQGEEVDFNFPNLQVLEIAYNENVSVDNWIVPKLKMVTLGLQDKASLLTNFPSSMEEFWLVDGGRGLRVASLRRKGLDSLKKFYPKVKSFRIDWNVEFYQDEVIKMVKARKAAVNKGLMVDGVAMRAINKLVIDFSQLDSSSLSKLQELVPEVVNARFASTEVIIDC